MTEPTVTIPLELARRAANLLQLGGSTNAARDLQAEIDEQTFVRPAEPTSIGAVISTQEGLRRWVRIVEGDPGDSWWIREGDSVTGDVRRWSDFGRPVVVHEGWPGDE